MTLGYNVKIKRTQMGLTTKKLAERVGINPSTISSIENEKHSPSIFFVEILADIFGCSIDELCGRVQED